MCAPMRAIWTLPRDAAGGRRQARPRARPKPKRASRDEIATLRQEVSRAEARIAKLEDMRDKLAKKLADPAIYEEDRAGDLRVWQAKYAEVMDAHGPRRSAVGGRAGKYDKAQG